MSLDGRTRTVGQPDPADAAAARAELKFEALVESAPDAMVIVDAEGRIDLVNAQTERLFGYRREELLGRRVEALLPDRLRDQHAQHRDYFAAHPRVRNMGAALDLMGRRKDGSEFAVEISLSPIEAQAGLVAAEIRDVTDRRAAEMALLEAAIVASSNDAMIAKTLDGVITHWNHGAARLYGYSSEEVIGKNIAILLPPGQVDEILAALALIEGVDVSEPVDTVRVRKDGSLVDVSLRVSAIRDDNGVIVGASTVSRDITERKKVEAALAERTADLARSNAELEQFAYVASHDLQEPLRHISAFVQKLADRYTDLVDEQGRRYIGYVVDGATRMQALIEALLELSRVGRDDLRVHEVDLDEVVRAACRAVSAQGEAVKALITTDALPRISGDEDLLYRLFVNLLANALKFGRAGIPPRVEIVHERRTDGCHKIHVRDNGIGIDPAYRERAFDIFERLNGNDYPGTGIGLSVARRIVEAHAGRITLGESAGGGLDVIIVLPAVQSQQELV